MTPRYMLVQGKGPPSCAGPRASLMSRGGLSVPYSMGSHYMTCSDAGSLQAMPSPEVLYCSTSISTPHLEQYFCCTDMVDPLPALM